eukprot:15365838-Ditylum_brightwellii.AAC.1
MERLRARAVARGDLQHRDEFTDTWSSCVSMKRLRMLLAMAAKLKKGVKQADLIGAYLQAKDTNDMLYFGSTTQVDFFGTIHQEKDQPLSKEEEEALKEKFSGLDFRYLRRESNLGICFHLDVSKSPTNQISNKHKIGSSDILVYTDASWQDCPDTGRSTTCYYIFYQGGVIEGNSQVNVPIAMPSAESEYMAACSAYMTAGHIHMMANDSNFLGTSDYDKIQIALPNPPIVIMCDNQAAVHMTKNDQIPKRNHPIPRRFHYVRDGQKMSLHIIKYCPKEDQLEDIEAKTQ